jgi:exodeoxyribonuclease V gamma subunit
MAGGRGGRPGPAGRAAAAARPAQALAQWARVPELPPHSATLDLQVAGQPWQLQVALAGLRPDGLLRHRYADAGASDHISTWIDHLALCACAPAGVAGRSQWLGREARFAFKPCDEPIGPLQTLLGLYAQGQREPLYFFPKSAWAWAQGGRRLAPARSAWTVSARTPYAEQADAAHRLALRGLPDPMGDGAARFEAAAAAVLDPLLACIVSN